MYKTPLKYIIAAFVAAGAMFTAAAYTTSPILPEKPEPSVFQNVPPQSLDWEVDGQTCILKLQAYKTSTFGSTYYLLDIRPQEQILHAIDVPGRQKPIKELGAPVRTQCIDRDGQHYTRHHEDKLQFVAAYDKSETNRLWSTSLKHANQMGLF